MIIYYYCTVISVCVTLGNSLGNTRNQSPSEERYNFFDAELLQLFSQKEKGNVLISPIGIKLVLGMMLEGAENQTAEEIRTALRLPEEEDDRRKEFSRWLSTLQEKESPNILKLANRIFVSNRYPVNPNYEKTLRKYYSGGVTTVKFENGKEASHAINTWVENQTSKLIPGIVSEGQISPGNKLMLASAVYFKGIWSKPFASERSAVKCFYANENKCEDSRMMTETGYFRYGYISRLNAKAIVLPYKGGKFSMLLLLPAKRGGVKLLGRDLVHLSLGSVLSELEEHEVFVQIPQFEISYNEDLANALKTLQISEAFSPKANFSKLFASRVESTLVGQLFHSTKITVNEEGSEAAATTGALFVPLMGGTTISFVANRPFIFFVMDSVKNSILFAGKVVSPRIQEDSSGGGFLPSRQRTPSKKAFPQGQLFAPLATRNSSAGITEPVDKSSVGMKRSQRGQQQGPKFRSIKPSFPLTFSNEKGQVDPPGRFKGPNTRRTFVLRPFEKETRKKGGMPASDFGKAQKRKESELDDWRHHVLFFT